MPQADKQKRALQERARHLCPKPERLTPYSYGDCPVGAATVILPDGSSIPDWE